MHNGILVFSKTFRYKLAITLYLNIIFITTKYAIGNEDYSSGPFVVTIPAGQTSASFDIAITDDNLMENNKSFNVIIDPSSLPSIVTVGMPGQATVTIVDDDSK